MVEDPARFIDLFDRAGADTLIVHYEVLDNPRPVLEDIKARRKRVGMAINPGTPVEVLADFVGELDLALCMTVWPGFGGQAFLPESPGRIEKLRRLIQSINPACDLEVDGGIDRKTAPACVRAGANVLVAGTAIFGAADGPRAATAAMAALAGE
jgi:ribulose-phosphate 3-epimerase